MITRDARTYDYFTLGEPDAHGQATLPGPDAVPAGQIKMTISLTTHSTQDNINFSNAQYLGITHAPIDDTYIIQYGEERLKVLFVHSLGRHTQAFMTVV